MNDTQLRSFVEVAKYKSFSKGAEALFISRQALHKQIDALEKELGFSLFMRTAKGTTTTPAGNSFYNAAIKILKIIDSAKERGQELARSNQSLRIENPHHPRLLLEKVYAEFSHRYPEIDLVISYQIDEDHAGRVLDGSIDLAEAVTQPEMNQPGLSYKKVSSLPYFCILAPNHPLAQKKELHFEDLSGQRIGLFHRHRQRLVKQFEARCENVSFTELQKDDIAAIYNICYGRGVYIAIGYFAKTLDNLVKIPLVFDNIPESVLLYKDPPSPLVKLFLETVEEVFSREETE